MTTYSDLGYNRYGSKIEPTIRRLPYVPEALSEYYFQGISGGLVSGGIIYSKNNKLAIDLENGTITYTNEGTKTTIAG